MKSNLMKLAIIVAGVVGMGTAHAAVPAEVTDMMVDLATDFGLFLAAAFTLLAVCVSGYIMLGWGKKLPKKAAG